LYYSSFNRDAISLKIKLIVAGTLFENMSTQKKRDGLQYEMFLQGVSFEYCEQLGPRRTAESTIMAPVGRDADHDHAETRYEPNLHRQDQRKKTENSKNSSTEKEVQDSAFC
jgi:hypothetical protein